MKIVICVLILVVVVVVFLSQNEYRRILFNG